MRRALLLTVLALPAAAQSFTVDEGLFGVRALARSGAVEPVDPTGKPSGLLPLHGAAELDVPGQTRKGSVTVVELAAFRELFRLAPSARASCVERPLKALRRALRDPARAGELSTRPMSCPDASAAFALHPRRVEFAGGAGVLYLTQWMIESVSPSNEGLELVFEGLTRDERYWVHVAVPVRLTGFIEGEGALELDPRRARARDRAAERLAVRLGPAALTPTLEQVEALVRSLVVRP